MRFVAILVPVLTAALTGGCVYIPGPVMTDTTVKRNLPNPSGRNGFLGTRDSNKPVRPGASRDQVRAYLGDPDMLNDKERIELYPLNVHVGWLWSLLPGHLGGSWDYSISTHWKLLIEFDEAGKVRSWQQTRPENVEWQKFHSFLFPESAAAGP